MWASFSIWLVNIGLMIILVVVAVGLLLNSIYCNCSRVYECLYVSSLYLIEARAQAFGGLSKSNHLNSLFNEESSVAETIDSICKQTYLVKLKLLLLMMVQLTKHQQLFLN
jgi:hypothetical protein